MLLNNHTALWKKIREFPLNEPGAATTFSHKLQEQQEWSASYTERVIEEYRKFIFLCTVAPKGASPSKAVDEAWHLHLTYTKSYWIDLCKNTLGRDLHHHPSKGGNDEDHKHEEWYKETLAFYRQAFGTEPPSDIWPPPLDANAPIPEPDFPVTNQEKWVYGVLLLLPFLFGLVFFGQMVPFILDGPDFLWFFPILVFSLLGIYVLMRLKRRKFYRNLVYDILHEDIGLYDKIFFLFGKHGAVQVAIVDLVRRELLQVRGYKTFIVHNDNIRRSPTETNVLIDGLMNEPDREIVYYDDIYSKWYPDKPIHPLLVNLREFAYRPEPTWTVNWVWMTALLVGALRLMQGLYNGRPVSFLLAEIALLIVLCVVVRQLFLRRVVIYKWAEEVLEQQAYHGPLHKDEIVNQFALRGSSALTLFSDGLLLASFFAGYQMMNHGSFFGPSTSRGYGSGTGSCGSSGGCGSSDGGGGSCGGGGCGGCGGGGGD
jgi:hypothetical protein